MPQQDNINSSHADVLSPLARQIMAIDLAQAYTSLVVKHRGRAQAQSALEKVAPEQLFASPVKSMDNARALLAGLWLWHDCLEESHRIAQAILTPTGSFWHAIMHRREGDFANSKYWYARCAEHPVFAAMLAHANGLINPMPADVQLLRLVNNGWNPDALVDLVESVHNQPDHPLYDAAITLQQTEWRLLFDHCTRAAVAG